MASLTIALYRHYRVSHPNRTEPMSIVGQILLKKSAVARDDIR